MAAPSALTDPSGAFMYLPGCNGYPALRGNVDGSGVQVLYQSGAIPPGAQTFGCTARDPAGGFYLLGLSTSGLAVGARKGDTTIYVRSTTGMSTGDTIMIDGESHKIISIGTAAGAHTPQWQPLPDGPVITIPAGSTNVPVTIPDRQTVNSTINVTDSFLVQNLVLTLDITHTNDPDLTAVLIGPDGTRVTLFSGVGQTGDRQNFSSTVFDDTAMTAIQNGGPPFQGRFTPQICG